MRIIDNSSVINVNMAIMLPNHINLENFLIYQFNGWSETITKVDDTNVDIEKYVQRAEYSNWECEQMCL